MSLPIFVQEEAEAEFDEAFDWYENQRPGRGVAFSGRVQEVFDRISANPLLHAIVSGDVRKAIVSKFPYNVYYRVEATRVAVIAVFHQRRDPSIWQARV
jgi:toxin ParE1/3/4